MTDRSLKPFITEASARKFVRAAGGDFLHPASEEEALQFLRKLRNDRVNWSHKEENAEPTVKLKRKGKSDGKTKKEKSGEGQSEGDPPQETEVHASSEGVAADHD